MISQAPKVPMVFLCAYCGQKPELVSGKVIYPHRPDLYAKKFWNCEPCGAYVGCHPGTENPLGRLANAELRAAKQQAHAAFDPLWKDKKMKRKDAYYWLSKELGIPYGDAHIGHFDVELCKRTVEVCAHE
jgi:hypothetical protein